MTKGSITRAGWLVGTRRLRLVAAAKRDTPRRRGHDGRPTHPPPTARRVWAVQAGCVRAVTGQGAGWAE